MPLNKLENFIKNTEGKILYVNPNDIDATDSISNQGNSLTQPFKTIQRALLESARFSYLGGADNDIIEKTTILIYPGDHTIDNRPGFGIKVDPGNSSAAQVVSPSGALASASELHLTLNSNFDITEEDNILYKFNSINGGVIIPRGTSLVGLDLRKTKIRPKYVPNPTDPDAPYSSLFRVTGTCYFWQFSMFDGDENGIVYTDKSDFSTNNQSKPTFSHHKLSCFEYADGVNVPEGYTLTDLGQYYAKLSNAYNVSSTREILSADRYPTSDTGFAPQRPEFEIVGAFANDPIAMASIKSGDGATPSTTITVTTTTAHGLNTGTPIKIKGVPVPDYNISTKVSSVVSATEFTYILPFVRNNLPPNPSAATGTITIETDTVSGASPYIFNCSLRSVWGMNGMLADGNKATGFRSMVVAQFTGISLQKDDRAFVKYDKSNRSYEGLNVTLVRGSTLATQSSSTDTASVYHLDSDAVYRKGWGTTHIKMDNDAIMQIVSVFAIGYQQHFDANAGGDASVTNSNSNFGQISLSSKGFKKAAFVKDNNAFVTSLITPRSITGTDANIDFQSLDVGVTTAVGVSSHLYLFGFTNQDDPPPTSIQGYRIGARENDQLFARIVSNNGAVDNIRQASIFMTDNSLGVGATVIQGTSSSLKKYVVQSGPTDNKLALGAHEIQTGEKIRIFSYDGDLPENIEDNKLYYAIDLGNNDEIKLASSATNASNGTEIIIFGGTNLYIESRVHDKEAGDIGHPIQFDSNVNNWFLHVNTNNTIYPDLVTLGEGGNVGIGPKTTVTTIKRIDDPRGLDEKVYKLRVVIPKETIQGKNPEEGFIIQESSSTGAIEDSDLTLATLEPNARTKFNVNKNLRLIDNATVSGMTVTIETELPHNLKVGENINVKNITDTSNTVGTFDVGYNGTFEVAGITDEKTFTYSRTDISGVTHTIPSSLQNNISSRTKSSPRFERNDIKSNYYIYRNEVITPYIQDIQDGVYHLFVIKADNTVTEEFTDNSYSQRVVDLYPQRDRDNINDNPPTAKSFALRNPLGDVVTNELKNSITRESLNQFVQDFGQGLRISGVSTTNTLATLTFDRRHNFRGIVTGSITGGSGYPNGTYYNVKILSGNQAGTWSGALATVEVSGGAVSSVVITSGGSAYTAGTYYFEQAKIGNGNADARFVVTSSGLSSNDNDVLQITGLSTSTDFYGRITSVPSATTVSLARTTGDPVPSIGEFAINLGPSQVVSSVYESTSGISTFTTTTGHGLVAGNSFQVVNSSNVNLGEFNVKGIESPVKFSASTSPRLTSNVTSGRIFRHGMNAADAISDASNENLGARGMSFYDGENLKLVANINNTATALRVDVPNSGIGTANRLSLGSYIQIDSEMMRVTSSTLTGSANDEITVIRGVLGTVQKPHTLNSIIRKIKPLPIELRRPSIIRASGHTFEYVGYGPGNYSTGLPQVQVRTLNEREEFLVQSQEKSCGTVVYTGMNNRGDFFIGNKRVSSATGQERTFDAPIPTITGEDPSRLSVIFDEVVVKERLIVEGGRTNKILSQFDGPVTFNKEVKINDNLTVTGLLKLESDIEVTSETQSTNKDTGCMVLEGGLGVEKNLNVGGITTITDYLNVTDGHIAIEAGTSNEGYRIDSGSDIEMSLFRSTVSGTPIVLSAKDGKRLIIGENDTANVEIVDAINGTNRAVFTPNEQKLYWDGSLRFQTYDSGVEITGFTTTTAGLMVGAAATVTGLLNAKGNVDLGDATSDTITVTGRFDSDLVPTGTTRDLGSSTNEWRNLFIDGTAKIDALEADTAKVGDLTDNRVVIAGTDGELEDSANLTFDGSTLGVTGNGNLSGWLAIGSTASFIGNIAAVGGVTGDVTGDLTGNATTATDLSINATNRILYQSSNNDTQVLAAGSNNQILKSNGGSSAPSWTDDIEGNAATATKIRTTNKADASPSAHYLTFVSETGTKTSDLHTNADFYVLPDTTASQSDLLIRGDITAFAAAASDDKLKTNKVTISDALDKVLSLSGFTFEWNELGAKVLGISEGSKAVGVSAQEVEKIVPEAVKPIVTPEGDEFLSVKYEKLVPLLIEAIKELNDKVENLQQQLSDK